MAYCITDDCTACGQCASGCPAGAIKEDKKGYSIESDQCTDCGSCAEVCPISAAKKA